MKLLARLKNLGALTEIRSGHTSNSDEIRSAVESRVAQFKKQGLQAGDRVLLHYGNSKSFFTDLFSIWILGGGVVPVDISNPQDLSSQSHASYEIKTPSGALELIAQSSLKPHAETAEAHLILFTSGSTGEPKIIIHTLAALEDRISALEKNLPPKDFERSLCVLPTYFGHGLIGNCLFPLLTGQHLFIAPAFDRISLYSIASLVDQYQLTFFSSVPSIWRLLKGHRGPTLNSLKRVHCASAPFADDLYEQIKFWAPSAKIYNVYGTTEMASWVSGYEIQSGTSEIFVGMGWGVEFKLTDVINEQGYVWIRSLLNEKNSDWVKTGDLGSWNSAYGLKLMGRSDDCINKDGLKINPDQVEAQLNLHSDIVFSSVFSRPHEITGEAVTAAVVLKKKSQIDTAQLENWCRQAMAPYQVPTRWFVLQEIPTNGRGKISRHAVRKLCLSLKDSN